MSPVCVDYMYINDHQVKWPITGKTIEANQLEKELKDQDRKFYRAQNVVEKLSQELKEFVPNPEVFEHDMDLREEKEKQRSALIRLRELSQERVLFYLGHFHKALVIIL